MGSTLPDRGDPGGMPALTAAHAAMAAALSATVHAEVILRSVSSHVLLRFWGRTGNAIEGYDRDG